MYVICDKANKAEKFQRDMDQILGMPWPGKRYGGAQADVQTLHLVSIRKHPVQDKWALKYDSRTKLHVNDKKDVELPAEATIEELTPDW